MPVNVKLSTTLKKWLPTRKWWAAAVGLYTPITLQAIDSGWDKVETKEAVIALSGLLLAYITGNAPDPVLPSVTKK